MNANEGAVPARRILDELLERCVRRDASDLHVSGGRPAYYRVHGPLVVQAGDSPLSAEGVSALVAELLDGRATEALERTGSIDGAFSFHDGTRFRFNVFRRQGEYSVAIRRLEERFRTLADLGLDEKLYNLCDLPDGLVIVAGPTGAGKSTTLATLLDRINRTRPCHIITIEDPIEYLHVPAASLINQRQVGTDAASFNDALVAALRQDPDVILVGEIRDLATIRTAITAAETGHLVFTTVHAGDCVGTIERLVSVFPADEQEGMRRQLSLVLRAVIAQRLVIADGDAPGVAAMEDGRRKRVSVSEVMVVNAAVSNLIANGKSSQIYSTMEAGSAAGMQTLEQDLARLLMSRQITEITACAFARQPQVLLDIVKTRSRSTSGVHRVGGFR